MVEKSPPPELLVYQPSMSKAEALLDCQWPWFKPIAPVPFSGAIFDEDFGSEEGDEEEVDHSDEPARFGSAVHEIIAARILHPPKKLDIDAIAKKWGEDINVEELRSHTEEAVVKLRLWLSKENPWGFNFTKHAKARVEQAFAYRIYKKTTRVIQPPTADTHRYIGLEEHEFPGTADLVIDEIDCDSPSVPDFIMIDHKTGEGFALPLENAQLKSLTLAGSRRINAKRPAMGIFHTGRITVSTMFADDIEREELSEFANELEKAWSNIGTGLMRPGPHCSRCPAINICPAHQTALAIVEKAEAALASMTPEKLAQQSELVTVLNAKIKAWRGEAKEWVRKNGPGVFPNGDLLDIVKSTRRNLSLASIKRAYGEEVGGRKIAQLEKDKAVELKDIESLRRVKDK